MRSAQATLLVVLISAVGTNLASSQDPRQPTESTRLAQDLPLLPNPKSSSPAKTAEPAKVSTTAPADAVIMNSRSFGIPFNVDSVGTQPVEVQLLVSRGDSKWELLDRKPPRVKRFQFKGKDDGLFWFATRTVDAAGQPFPNGPVEPQLKVFIDTAKPRVTLNAEADASGQIDVSLRLDDETPVKRIQLHYATDVVRQWQTLDARTLQTRGRTSFAPTHQWQQVSLQAIVTDSAGNQTTETRTLQRPRLASGLMPRLASDVRPSQTESGISARPASGPPLPTTTPAITQTVEEAAQTPLTYQRQPAATAETGLPIRGIKAEVTPRGLQVIAPQKQTFGPPALQSERTPYPAGSTTRLLPQAASPNLPLPLTRSQVSDDVTLNSPGQAAPTEDDQPVQRRPRTAAEAIRPISEQSAVSKNESPTPETIPTPTGAQADLDADSYAARRITEAQFDQAILSGRVPVRYSDSNRFSLEYELEAVGSSGVGAVELYGTITGGKTWVLWGSDPDRSSPFDIETKGEGVFGYRIVVVGRNGLASPRPLAGEAPDIVVVVDNTQPNVHLKSAQYGAGDRTGSLVIGYECEDKHLMQRPIALSFSESAEGPWTTIAAGLRNDGLYVWPADPQLPRQIYLRIDATDRAGNVGTYILDQPIETQGLAPRARIRGFQSLSGNEPAGTDEQTANRPQAAFK